MLSDEQLAQIRSSRDTMATHPDGKMLCSRYVRHIDSLLAERDALRARLAEAEPIIAAVAALGTCVWCSESYPNHAKRCPVTKARVYLATARADAEHAQPVESVEYHGQEKAIGGEVRILDGDLDEHAQQRDDTEAR